jgi:hypothetical protein
MKTLIFLGVVGLLILLGIGVYFFETLEARTITLYPITDICGRPLVAPVGTPEADLQMSEAGKLYQGGNC